MKKKEREFIMWKWEVEGKKRMWLHEFEMYPTNRD